MMMICVCVPVCACDQKQKSNIMEQHSAGSHEMGTAYR